MPAVVRLMKANVEQDPDDLRARFTMIVALMELSRFREALQVVEEILTEDPAFENGATFALKGICCTRLRWHDDAVDAFQRALEHGAPEFETKVQLANSYVAMSLFSKAEGTLQSALESGGTVLKSSGTAGLLWGEVAKVRFDAGDRDGSDAAFFRSAQYEPKSPQPWIRRAQFYIDRGEGERAKRSAERARKISPGNPDAVVVWAESLLQTGAEDQAFAVLHNANADVRAIVGRRPTTFWMLEEE